MDKNNSFDKKCQPNLLSPLGCICMIGCNPLFEHRGVFSSAIVKQEAAVAEKTLQAAYPEPPASRNDNMWRERWWQSTTRQD